MQSSIWTLTWLSDNQPNNQQIFIKCALSSSHPSQSWINEYVRPTDRSINQLINQSVAESVNQLFSQYFSRSVNFCYYQSISDSQSIINQSKLLFHQPINHPTCPTICQFNRLSVYLPRLSESFAYVVSSLFWFLYTCCFIFFLFYYFPLLVFKLLLYVDMRINGEICLDGLNSSNRSRALFVQKQEPLIYFIKTFGVPCSLEPFLCYWSSTFKLSSIVWR